MKLPNKEPLALPVLLILASREKIISLILQQVETFREVFLACFKQFFRCISQQSQIKEALVWSKISARAKEDPSVSGSVLLALGKVKEAERSFINALDKNWRLIPDEASFGLNLSKLGLIECRRGNVSEGLRKLVEAVSLAKNSRGFTARTLRALVEGYFRIGELETALTTLTEVIKYCKLHGLLGQKLKAEKLQAEILNYKRT